MEQREIKFQAWDPVFEEMYSPFSGTYISFNGKIHNGSIQKEWILIQYTGFKDKNGEAIYEGFYMRHTSGDPLSPDFEVYIDPVRMKDGCWTVGDYSLHEVAEISEIIGNVFQNPELLNT